MESYEELEQASHELGIIEANLEVYAGMGSFEGTAAGSKEAADHYIRVTAPRVAKLRSMLWSE